MSRGSGCLLLGSVPLQDAETVFRRAEQALPRRLLYIPDGETGNRSQYTLFQFSLFPASALSFPDNSPLSEEQLAVLTKHFEENEIRTGYEDAAIQSYGVFKTLKAQGIIPPTTKFQVGLPTIANVIGAAIKPGVQKLAAPCYERALLNAISRIQENIPHDELAIQIDMGMDIAGWEDFHMTEPYWNELQWNVWFDRRLYVAEYITRMIDQVEETVDVGLHFCYGTLLNPSVRIRHSLIRMQGTGTTSISRSQSRSAALLTCTQRYEKSAHGEYNGFIVLFLRVRWASSIATTLLWQN